MSFLKKKNTEPNYLCHTEWQYLLSRSPQSLTVMNYKISMEAILQL